MGWANESLFVDYLKHFVARERPSKADAVELDSRVSHLLIPAISVVRENGIVLFTLAPCASRKLQPSDCTVLVYIKHHNAYRNDVMPSNPANM
jgi:hypothetical protein